MVPGTFGAGALDPSSTKTLSFGVPAGLTVWSFPPSDASGGRVLLPVGAFPPPWLLAAADEVFSCFSFISKGLLDASIDVARVSRVRGVPIHFRFPELARIGTSS